jgi:hypothetical protein
MLRVTSPDVLAAETDRRVSVRPGLPCDRWIGFSRRFLSARSRRREASHGRKHPGSPGGARNPEAPGRCGGAGMSPALPRTRRATSTVPPYDGVLVGLFGTIISMGKRGRGRVRSMRRRRHWQSTPQTSPSNRPLLPMPVPGASWGGSRRPSNASRKVSDTPPRTSRSNGPSGSGTRRSRGRGKGFFASSRSTAGKGSTAGNVSPLGPNRPSPAHGRAPDPETEREVDQFPNEAPPGL